MTTTPSPLADAHELLLQDMYGHLDETEFLALKCQEWSDDDQAAARKLVPDLVTVIRAMVAIHEAPFGANCPHCATPWPCSMFEIIHRLVKDPDREFVRLMRQDELP